MVEDGYVPVGMENKKDKRKKLGIGVINMS